jgi:acetyltransferase-like isoleucine patch superfamily enzyme
MHIGASYFTDEELLTFGFKHIGKNVKIKRNVGIFFTENISIGDNVRIDDHTIIVASSHSTDIGSYIHIASNCYIAASDGFEMGDFSGLAPGVMIFTGVSDYSGEKLTNPTVDRKYIKGPAGKVTIGRHATIGAGTVVMPRLTIGEGAAVGTCSLVRGNLAPWNVYSGNPAKKLWSRSKKLLELEELVLSEKAAIK